MARKVTYWVSTVLVAALSVFAGFAYLSGSPQAVQGFAHVGYPQQLRIILGIAKLLWATTRNVPCANMHRVCFSHGGIRLTRAEVTKTDSYFAIAAQCGGLRSS